VNDSHDPDLQRVATEAMKKGLSVGGWSKKQAGAFLRAAIRVKHFRGARGRLALTDFEAQIQDLGLEEQRERVGGVNALTIWPESADACLAHYRRRIRGGRS